MGVIIILWTRNAEPIELLKKANTLFLNRISEIVTVASSQVPIIEQLLLWKK